MKEMFTLVLMVLLSTLAASPAFGQSSTLTSDWWGARSSLADNGVTADIRHTSFYQGLVSGTGKQDFEYGGKVDAFINFDTSKMGLWEGGGFRSHIEYSHGDLATNLGGTLFATNAALYWPVGTPEELVATSLCYTQKVGDRSSVLIGKFNPVDLLATDPFFGGWGFYLKAALADGNPNYVKSSLIAGIGGRALFLGARKILSGWVRSTTTSVMCWKILCIHPSSFVMKQVSRLTIITR